MDDERIERRRNRKAMGASCMKTVWIVTWQSGYEDHMVDGVFSTEELAIAYVDKHGGYARHCFTITPWTIDDEEGN
jgi:hypothetical protein